MLFINLIFFLSLLLPSSSSNWCLYKEYVPSPSRFSSFIFFLILFLVAWEELAVYNLDFLGCFDGKVTVQDLNVLEMNFLNLIQYPFLVLFILLLVIFISFLVFHNYVIHLCACNVPSVHYCNMFFSFL